MRQQTDIIGVAEVNQLAIYKIGVGHLGSHRDQYLRRIVMTQQSLAVIYLFLVKRQVDGLIRYLVLFEFDLMQILQPLACLCGRGSA